MTSPLLDLFYQLRNEEGFPLSIEQYYRVENYLIQKDLPLGKFLDDSIVLAILERKFLLSLRIIKFSQ